MANQPLKSPLLRNSDPETLRSLKDLNYDPGFQKLESLIREFVEEQTERMVRDPHIPAEDLRDLAAEIRLFRGILDIPAYATQICRKEG